MRMDDTALPTQRCVFLDECRSKECPENPQDCMRYIGNMLDTDPAYLSQIIRGDQAIRQNYNKI